MTSWLDSPDLPDLPVTARRVLGGYLEGAGFHQLRDHGRSSICFERAGVLVALQYSAEYGPPWSVDVALGLLREGWIRDSWALEAFMPEEARADGYGIGRFSDEIELEASLVRVRDRLLPEFARPYWGDPERVDAVLVHQHEIRDRERLKDISDRHLRTARRAFQEKDHRTALEHYLLADVELSKVDEKRRSIARRDLTAEQVARRRRWWRRAP